MTQHAAPVIEQQILRAQPGPQEKFLASDVDVAFYGGAAGGGKSYALLLEALYDTHNPLFGAVIFRRTRKQVTDEGGLWDTASEIYQSIGAKLNQSDLMAEWPNGGRVSFAGMEHEKNRLDWQGAQIPYIGFDELTHFTWKQFNYMMSRNRSASGARSRIRATLNPDPDHWVRSFIDWYIGEDGYAIPERSGVVRFFVVDGDDIVWGDSREELIEINSKYLPKSFTFIASSLKDNKILMEKDPAYLANLQSMSRVDRAQLLDGNWNIRAAAGMYFKRSQAEVVDVLPKMRKKVRGWDQAGTKEKLEKAKMTDPDWTVGCKMELGVDGYYYVTHVERFREEGSKVDQRIKNIATSDGPVVQIRLAQDPGQAGKRQAVSQIQMLAGYVVTAKPVTGDKETRAKPFASQWEAGNVKVLRAPWNEVFFKELENFPETTHDDQVDAASDAFEELLQTGLDYSKLTQE